MSTATLARVGLYGGVAVAVTSVVVIALLTIEGLIAKRMIQRVNLAHAPNPSGWYGAHRRGTPVTIALLGDSSASGYGMTRQEDTPGAGLASGVAEKSGLPVLLHDLSVVGAKSSDLHEQVEVAIEDGADVAVILIGANDVTRVVRPSVAVKHLTRAVQELDAAGITVIVGTCPDLGTIEPILPPLRQVARAWSRRLAAEQTYYTLRAGGRTVSLADVLGPEFTARLDFFMGPDQFHPSAAGYLALADVLLPSTLAALELLGEEEAVHETYHGLSVVPVAAAMFKAVNRPGTVLDRAPRPRGRLGRLWVNARKFSRQEHGRAEAPHERRDASLVEPDERSEEASRPTQ